LLPEIFTVLLTLSFGLPLGLTPLQVLSIDLGTEMAAAITLAYEPAEPGIMNRRPRPPNTTLVGSGLLIYSYVIAGGVETAGWLLAYFWVYGYHGLSPSDIFLQGDDNFKPSLPSDTEDVCTASRCYSREEQEIIAGEATAAWYITLIMSQVAHIWLIKSATVSVFSISPFNNIVTVYGVLLELFILFFFVYVPGVQGFMGMSTPRPFSWVPWLGVAFILLVYTECALVYTRRKQRKDELRLQEHQASDDTQLDGPGRTDIILSQGRNASDNMVSAAPNRPVILESLV